MSRVLIIGYGNPLRGDDGFGWHLARRLQKKCRDAEIEIIACHQLTPDLAEKISRAHDVIFADASNEPQADEVALRKLTDEQPTGNDFSHHLNPPTLLKMARLLYDAKPRAAFLVTAPARELGYGEHLSPQMTAALDKASTRIVALCDFLAPHCSDASRDIRDLSP